MVDTNHQTFVFRLGFGEGRILAERKVPAHIHKAELWAIGYDIGRYVYFNPTYIEEE